LKIKIKKFLTDYIERDILNKLTHGAKASEKSVGVLINIPRKE
jgi:hypothetical protein